MNTNDDLILIMETNDWSVILEHSRNRESLLEDRCYRYYNLSTEERRRAVTACLQQHNITPNSELLDWLVKDHLECRPVVNIFMRLNEWENSVVQSCLQEIGISPNEELLDELFSIHNATPFGERLSLLVDIFARLEEWKKRIQPTGA